MFFSLFVRWSAKWNWAKHCPASHIYIEFCANFRYEKVAPSVAKWQRHFGHIKNIRATIVKGAVDREQNLEKMVDKNFKNFSGP